MFVLSKTNIKMADNILNFDTFFYSDFFVFILGDKNKSWVAHSLKTLLYLVVFTKKECNRNSFQLYW